VDNPLADPFDAELVGFHSASQAEITLKCIARQNTEERVGILVQKEGHPCIVEYSEMPENEWKARNPDGTFKHPYANTSLFCFSMEFIQRISREKISLPLHSVLKPAKSKIGETKAWKFEKFIFDLLAYAEQIAVIEYPRERCFAPLKNKTGLHSIETVRQALQAEAHRIFTEVTGTPSPQKPFEISQEFHYPTIQLLNTWKGKNFPENRDYL
jgi:UDP-N-acetylglucosamine/UDP-N-acetylgalactosamine diphosphorylase